MQGSQTTHGELKEDLKTSGIELGNHTISRTLRSVDISSYIPRKTPLLRKRLVQVRLKYANYHLNKQHTYCWTWRLSSYSMKLFLMCKLHSHDKQLHTINDKRYRDIRMDEPLPSVRSFKLRGEGTFQQDSYL